jgi:sterol desaturase/sphingolipid hydroxylase (fatty acid hydroxylase superfamily)
MLEDLDTNAYYAFGIPLYVALMAFEQWLARRKGLVVYRFADTLGNFCAGLGEVTIGLFLGPALLWLYDFGYQHLRLVTWPATSLVPWVLAFFIADLGYWMYHRAGHSVGVLWAVHGVHHQSEELNMSVGTRHPWFADTYAFLFYIPVPMLGITSVQFFFAISAISLYALLLHSKVLRWPSLFIFTTPQTHIVHHATNPRYIGKNLGAMFTLWDRLFGTHVEVDPADVPRLGTRAGYRSHDAALSQWLHFRDLLEVQQRATGFRGKLLVWLKHPGWVPPGVTPAPRHPPARSSSEIPPLVRRYAAGQVALTIVFAMVVLWFRQHYQLGLQLAAAAVVLWSTWSIGGLLDGRERAQQHERLRLLGALLLAIALGASAGHLQLALVMGTLWCLSFVWALSARLTRCEPRPRSKAS